MGIILLVPHLSQAAQSFNFKSNELKVFNKQGKAIFTGNVKAWNDTASLEANRLEVHYQSGGDTVQYFAAYGDVKLDYPGLYTESDYAFRDVQSDTVLIQGNAYVKRNGNKFWADWIKIDLRQDTLHVKNIKRGKLISMSDGLFNGEE